MIIAMRGLPASGKTAIAKQLAVQLPATILDKDRYRALLFEPRDIEYSSEQDDFCMDIIYRVTGFVLRRDPHRHVIIDGRPFARQSQVDALKATAYEARVRLGIIECICRNDTAEQRLQQARNHQQHVAENRDYDLYRRLQAQWQHVDDKRLVLDTDRHTVKECVRRAMAYLGERGG